MLDREIIDSKLRFLKDFTAFASEIIRFLDTDIRINPQNREPKEQL